MYPQVYPTEEYLEFEDALDVLYAEDIVKQHPPQSAALAVRAGLI